jgi:hypothetical protein
VLGYMTRVSAVSHIHTHLPLVSVTRERLFRCRARALKGPAAECCRLCLVLAFVVVRKEAMRQSSCRTSRSGSLRHHIDAFHTTSLDGHTQADTKLESLSQASAHASCSSFVRCAKTMRAKGPHVNSTRAALPTSKLARIWPRRCASSLAHRSDRSDDPRAGLLRVEAGRIHTRTARFDQGSHARVVTVPSVREYGKRWPE